MAVVEDQRTQVYYWSSGISKNTFSFKHVTLIYLCLSFLPVIYFLAEE